VEDISVAIIGKPNVGKSTLFNKILNKNISLIDNIPGTTKDIIEQRIFYKNNSFLIFDTGGLKKKSKSKSEEQTYITKNTLQAIYKSNIVFFLVEANAGLTKADKQICRFILDKGKGLVFIINKIDLTENSREVVKEYFYSNVDLFDDALLHEPVSMNSVISGFPNKIFELALEIFRNSNKNINSKFLNIVIQNLVLKNRIPISNKYRPKIKFIKQVSTSPMIFKVFGSQLNKISHDYKRYLCKGILKKTNIKGVRVFLKFISAKNPYVAN